MGGIKMVRTGRRYISKAESTICPSLSPFIKVHIAQHGTARTHGVMFRWQTSTVIILAKSLPTTFHRDITKLSHSNARHTGIISKTLVVSSLKAIQRTSIAQANI